MTNQPPPAPPPTRRNIALGPNDLAQLYQACDIAKQAVEGAATILGVPIAKPADVDPELPLEHLAVRSAAVVGNIDRRRRNLEALEKTIGMVRQGLHRAMIAAMRDDPYMQAQLEAEGKGDG